MTKRAVTSRRRQARLHQPRFDINMWGIQISGCGVSGIIAAVTVVFLVIAVYKY